jgi:hypothetical protein
MAGLAHLVHSLMCVNQRKGTKATVEDFFSVIDDMRLTSRRKDVGDVLAMVWRARPHAIEFQRSLAEHAKDTSSLDPLFAALPQAIRFWAGPERLPVQVVHDIQAALTPERIAVLIHAMAHPHPDLARYSGRYNVRSIDLVDSKDDPRVQVADLFAGIARHLGGDALRELNTSQTKLLQPYVDQDSLWSDVGSWQTLTGRRAVGA